MTSIPRRRYLNISSFTANDLPAPEVAKIRLLAFGNLLENLSKITSDHEWRLIPYKIPLFSIRSLEINGKLPAREVVTVLLGISRSSIHSGNVQSNASSILCEACFTRIPYHQIFCSNFFASSRNFSASCS
jgi:hypothetical protein